MTNYRETSAYDLSLFEPQVVEPKRVREAEPVRTRQVKKQPVKKAAPKKSTKAPARKQSVNYTKTNETVRKAAQTVDSYQHTVKRNSQKAAVSVGLKKAIACLCVLFALTVVNLFMISECDRLDSQIAAMENEVSIAEGETVRLNAELNSMIDTEKVIEYAETKLGMVKAESYQITYINLSEGDEFVVSGDKEVDGKGEFSTQIKELFAYIF